MIMKSTTTREDRILLLSIILLTLVAAFLRFYNLGALSLTTDEVYDAMAIRAISDFGIPRFPDGTIYTRGVIHDYVGAAFAPFFSRVSELPARLPSALAGTFLVPLVYAGSKHFISKWQALGIAILFAFWPWSIEFSRWGRFYQSLTTLLFAVTFLSLYATRRRSYLLWAAVIGLAGLTSLNSRYGFFAWPILGLVSLFYIRETWRTPEFRQTLFGFIVFAGSIVSIEIIANTVAGHAPTSDVVSLLVGHASSALNSEYSAYYIWFFMRVLPSIGIGIGLLVASHFSQSRLSRFEWLFLALGLMSIIFVAFIHHHDETPRYLFFPAHFAVIPAFLGFERFAKTMLKMLVLRKGWRKATIRRIHVGPLLVSVFLTVTLGAFAHSWEIPFRKIGDSHNSIVPAFYSLQNTQAGTVSETRSTVEYINDVTNSSDTIISDNFQFYYFYAQTEPDYWIRVGRHNSFSPISERSAGVRYMARTETLTSYEALLAVVDQRTSESRRVFIEVRPNFGHVEQKEEILSWIERLKADGFEVSTAYRQGVTGNSVYLIR